MKSWTKTIALTCAASVLGLGVAMAQTPPATPDVAAPPADAAAAPAADAAPAKPMKPMKKPMKKPTKKTMKRSMSHKKPMAKKAM